MDEQAKISIASTGLEAPHVRILEFLISYYFEAQFSLSTKENSKVHIFNLNKDKNAVTVFERYKQQNPNTLFILIGDKKIEGENSQTIDFPVSPRKLFDALQIISKQLKFPLSEKEAQKVKPKPKKRIETKKKVHKSKKKEKKNNILRKNNSKIKSKVSSKITPKSEKNKKIKVTPEVKIKKDRKIEVSSKIKKNKKIEKNPKYKVEKDRKIEASSKENQGKELILINKIEEDTFSSKPIKEDSEVSSEGEYNFYTDLDSYVENFALDYLNSDNNDRNVISSDRSEKSTKNIDLDVIETDKSITITEDKLIFMSSRPDIDINNAMLVSKISYKAGEYLQGRLNNILRSPRFNSLNTSYGIITYNAKNHTACVNVDNRTLQSISSVAKLRMEYSLININKISRDENLVWEDADAVLWKVSIWASRGRLPLVYNNIDKKFSLKHWPNLTRFMMTPHSMEISAIWIKEPISLRKTLDLLNIKQRYVFSFYSAAIALDLITFETEDRKNSGVISGVNHALKQPKAKKKGVFSKLLKYFKPNNIEEI